MYAPGMTPRRSTLRLAAETLRLLTAPSSCDPAEKRTAKCRPSYGKCID
jgi:hypothetical protein